MSSKLPEFLLDQNLRFVPNDPKAVFEHIEALKTDLNLAQDFPKRVSLMGEIGFCLRCLDNFIEAEKYLLEALEVIQSQNLGIAAEVQQKIRLGHVWQEKKEFIKSNRLFAEVIQVCRENEGAKHYLDFALQHAGKNFFDQCQYQSALSFFSEALEIRLQKLSPVDQIESSQFAVNRTQELIGQVDHRTLDAYALKASEYSRDWLDQPEPTDMYELLQRFFLAGGKTVDIGCGNGRDANWLAANDFQVTGYDASGVLLSLASKLYPRISFKIAHLPKLSELQEEYDNVLCETVIMHLPKDQIPEAIQNLKRILKKGGVLYLSWRVTEQEDARHSDGRLYSAFDSEFVLNHFPKKHRLHFEEKISESSGKKVCRLFYKKE